MNPICSLLQLLPLFIDMNKPFLSGHRVTQSQYTIQTSAEHFGDAIIPLDEQRSIYISIVVLYITESIGISFLVHGFICTSLLPLKEYSIE